MPLARKTHLFTVIAILANVLGNFAMTHGLRRVGRLVTLNPWPYLEALFNPWVALGVSLLILWMLAYLALLSWADLSYVLPVTSAGYVLTAFAGKYLLGEHISPARWCGIALISLGVALVGRTPPRTAQRS